jgi:FG-GAP-like repeat
MTDIEAKTLRMIAIVFLAFGTALAVAAGFVRIDGANAKAQGAHESPTAEKTWTGSANPPHVGEWTANANWDGLGGASPGDILDFPSGVARTDVTNNFPDNTPFNHLSFFANYEVSGSQILLSNGLNTCCTDIKSNIPSGEGPTFRANLLLGNDARITQENGFASTLFMMGVIGLNGHNLSVINDSAATTIELDGAITGSGTLNISGPGTVKLAGNSGGFGSTNIVGGTVVLAGSAIGTVNLHSGTLRCAGGSIGPIVATGAPANGIISPGIGSGAGQCAATAATLAATSTFEVDLNGPGTNDILLVNGQNVFLNGANLVVHLNYTPGSGDHYTIVNETGAGIVAGQFAQGNSITVGGRTFTITYTSSSVVLTAPTIASPHTAFDFDGDHKTDISVFRPGPGEWYLNRSTQGFFGATFGQSTDKVTAADFTGDGKTDIAFFRPSNGNWFVLRSENSTFFAFPFGQNGDIPAVADFDADGKADATVYRPSVATWFTLKSSNGAITSTQFGISSDQPVPSDYDGDGKADIAVWRPGPGEWWILKSSNGQAVGAQFGQSTDKPTPGDYTGDGKADRAFFRPSTGNWFVLRSEDSSFFAFPFGQNGDKPVPGDYDGDGKFDAAVFRPTGSNWFILKSTGGTQITPFGLPTDIPVPGASIP